MKIAEAYGVDGRNLITRETYDPNPYLRRAAALREKGQNWDRNVKHIASFPQFLVRIWMKDRGISDQDREGIKKLLMEKARDGEWQKLLATSEKI